MDLKIRDVARLLDVSEETVYRWVKTGSLPSYRAAGNVLRAYGTTTARDVRGAFARIPTSAIAITALFLAIGGTPLFGPFWSELVIFQSAAGGHVWLAVLFVVLLAIAFLGMAGTLLPMLQGAPIADDPTVESTLSLAVPVAFVVASLVLGAYIPSFLADALHAAAGALGGGS
jgi:hydrogenase-4 component F